MPRDDNAIQSVEPWQPTKTERYYSVHNVATRVSFDT